MPLATGLVQAVLTRTNGVMVNIAQASDGLEAYVESKDLHFDHTQFCKFIDSMRLEIEGLENTIDFQVVLKHRDNLNEQLVEGSRSQIAQQPGTFYVRPPDSVYYRIRVEDNFILTNWKLAAIEVFGGLSGQDIV